MILFCYVENLSVWGERWCIQVHPHFTFLEAVNLFSLQIILFCYFVCSGLEVLNTLPEEEASISWWRINLY